MWTTWLPLRWSSRFQGYVQQLVMAMLMQPGICAINLWIFSSRFYTVSSMRATTFKLHVCACLVASALLLPPAHGLLHASVLPHIERIVVYKKQKIMCLLAGDEVIRSYRVALGRNPVGPKQQMGDCRTPEGAYVIDRHKADSRFYKSLHISYPNQGDIMSARNHGYAPGGDIMIHGLPRGYEDLAQLHTRRNWTKGCIAVNNSEMDEIWQMVADGTPIIIKP